MKDALYYNGSPTIPLYELNGDTFTVPVYVENGGKTYTLFACLRSAAFDEYKKVLSGITIGIKKEPGKNERENKIDSKAYAKFARDQFVDLIGLHSKKPIIAETLGDVLAFKIGNAAINNVTAKSVETDELVLVEEGDTQEIASEVSIANLETRTEINVNITHELRSPTEADRTAWDKVTKILSSEEGKAELTFVRVKHDAIARLYSSLAVALHGAVIGGEHCEEENKAEWLPKVPLPWQQFALGQLFNRVTLKNA